MMLGDCLLHLDHHDLTADCLFAIAAAALTPAAHTLLDAVTVDRYKALYERAVLDRLRSGGSS